MKIETKFNAGQNVFYMENNKVKSDRIEEIHVVDKMGAEESFIRVTYRTFEGEKMYSEHHLFATKQELLNSL